MNKRNNIITEYNQNITQIREMGVELSVLFHKIAIDYGGIKSYSWRIKTIDSIKEKSIRNKLNKLDEIQDIVGVRVIALNKKYFRNLDILIKKKFNILKTYIPNKNIESIHYLIIPPNKNPLQYKSEIQLRTAEVDSYYQLQHQIKHNVEAKDDTTQSKINLLNNKIIEFEKFIEDPNVHEKLNIHPFLATNKFLIDSSANEIYSEVQIGMGKEFQIDFLIQKGDGEYILVEIENSKHNLFTKNGDFTAVVNHSVKQVEDWQEWIEDNISSVQKKYPGILSPEGVVVIGRSRNFNHKEKNSLKRRNINMRGRIKIITYDDLLINARYFIKSISDNLK